jgi:hypothetical protein
MDKVRAKGRKDETEKAAGAAVPLDAEEDHDDLEGALLRPKPPVKSKGRGGTGIGRDLDH